MLRTVIADDPAPRAPSDGYCKTDLYMYYALTLFIPAFAGWKKNLAGREHLAI